MKSRGTVESTISNPRKSIRNGEEEWRNHGKKFRAQLLMKDEAIGSGQFLLSNTCDINRYYSVAEKVRKLHKHVLVCIVMER